MDSSYPEAIFVSLAILPPFYIRKYKEKHSEMCIVFCSIYPPNWEEAGHIIAHLYYKYSKTLIWYLPYNTNFNCYFNLKMLFMASVMPYFTTSASLIFLLSSFINLSLRSYMETPFSGKNPSAFTKMYTINLPFCKDLNKSKNSLECLQSRVL